MAEATESKWDDRESFKIGWSSVNITPDKPVFISGQFYARVSEGVMDPITATVLALESMEDGKSVKAIMISCDLIGISDGTRGKANMRDRVRDLIRESASEIEPEQIILNATHTHAAPMVSDADNVYDVALGIEVMPPAEYLEFAATRIAQAAQQAWESRKAGGISFGLSHAVVGRNRLMVNYSGEAEMYGNTNNPDFSHIEGYEDHSINLLYTWDSERHLTGVVINAAVPSQVSERSYLISSDFWHETRVELRERLGNDIFILPQASAAGDQSPHLMTEDKAEERMQHIMGLDKDGTGRGSIGQRQQIALRIADAVTSILPFMKENIEWKPLFHHQVDTVELPRRLLSIQDVKVAQKESEKSKKRHEELLLDLEKNPEKMKEPRWYKDVSISYNKMRKGQRTKERYELQKKHPQLPVEIHAIRIGDIVVATNPFELYVDYGIQMKARSLAVQTFIVQLTGLALYVPTKRAVEGGAYGATPGSNLIGPEGGKKLVEKTLELINALWATNEN